MGGLIAYGHDRQLTPVSLEIASKHLLLRSEYQPGSGGGGLPPYAGPAVRPHSWSAPFYNAESRCVSQIRGRIMDALYAGGDFHMIAIGDSKTRGSGVGDGESYLYGYAAIMRRVLGAVEGFIIAEDPANLADNRWTVTGLQLNASQWFPGLTPIAGHTGTFSAGFASDFAHTGGTFWVHAAEGATLTVTVDGGAAQQITVPAGDGFHPVTPTVTGTSAHTYQVTSPTPFSLPGFAPTYDGPRLKVSIVARGGSNASHWTPGYTAGGVGLWETMLLAAPDAILCGIGTNSRTAVDVPEVYAALATLDVPVVAIAPGGIGGIFPVAEYHAMYAALWDAADAYDLPLADFQSVIGDFDTATAAGLIADIVHENRHGYAWEAAALLALLAVLAALMGA